MLGISVALLWLTVFNIFLGPIKNDTHPQGYDRLFQVLDHGIEQTDEDENQMGAADFPTGVLCCFGQR